MSAGGLCRPDSGVKDREPGFFRALDAPRLVALLAAVRIPENPRLDDVLDAQLSRQNGANQVADLPVAALVAEVVDSRLSLPE